MAKIQAGILSQVRGAVGGVVGGVWKGQNYIRQRVTPANPNTEAQKAKRTEFAKAVAMGKAVLGVALNPYVDPFQKRMSGFNWFIKQNKTKFTEVPDYTEIILTDGKLNAPDFVDASFNNSGWELNLDGASYAGDRAGLKVTAVVYNPATGEVDASPPEPLLNGPTQVGKFATNNWVVAQVFMYYWVFKEEDGKVVATSRSRCQSVNNG